MRKILIIYVLFVSCMSSRPSDGQKSEVEKVKEQLSRSWSIISIGGNDLKTYEFARKAPELTLNLADKRLKGFGRS
ncbi:hypothetical protein JMN32_05595 [Fulvivirga sp. 29W222]|uniref:Uncharacterized protein n=1 Tax=Fulvivirga marina TaxID=2494733 RepID=A0A937KB94_9BACT|nr:hypothetical protein [Fulvivirga marina]MBL6445772.1 hypothetical protein [Fulvivirga marina]